MVGADLGLFHRCAARPDEFLSLPFWLPPVPRFCVTLAAIASCGLWLYFFTLASLPTVGDSSRWATLYMLSHLLIYLFGYVLIADLCSGWLLVNVWHNVQYIVFVWQYNRRRFASGVDPQAKALSWLVQPGWRRAGLYFAASIVLAMPFYYLLPWLGYGLDTLSKSVVPTVITIGLTLTFHHYIIDAVVWKRRHQPTSI